jgi:hypothetical protein
MADYRLLFLDRGDCVVLACAFRARNEMEAILIAEGQRGRSAMELWDEERKIKRWDPLPLN